MEVTEPIIQVLRSADNTLFLFNGQIRYTLHDITQISQTSNQTRLGKNDTQYVKAGKIDSTHSWISFFGGEFSVEFQACRAKYSTSDIGRFSYFDDSIRLDAGDTLHPFYRQVCRIRQFEYLLLGEDNELYWINVQRSLIPYQIPNYFSQIITIFSNGLCLFKEGNEYGYRAISNVLTILPLLHPINVEFVGFGPIDQARVC